MTEGFADEIVIGEKIIDSPEEEGTEGGIIKVGVDVVDGGVQHDAVHGLG